LGGLKTELKSEWAPPEADSEFIPEKQNFTTSIMDRKRAEMAERI
jgi:hypothetical protein